ncbi:MAG: V-type ATP synthase subunit F [Steroidobacterales bacterium]
MLIADEVTALGWRLIGAQVQVPGTETARVCFRAALRSADMVLITAEYARAIPFVELSAALLASKPLVLVIADLRHGHEPPAIEGEVRRALGVPA